MLTLNMNQEVEVKKDINFADLIDSLLSVLKKEVEIYEELLVSIHEERGVLKKPSLELLSYSNNKKETCILKAKMLEEVRGNVVKKIAKHLDREGNDINISVLISLTKGEQKYELITQQKNLLSLLCSIKKANEQNYDLLGYSLSYVKNSINFINNLLSTGADYVSSGKLNTTGLNGRILYREG